MVDPVRFINEFPDRIYHVHMKDAAIQLDGYTGILASHLNFGQPGRGWDFRSLGRGGVDFEEIIRALNQAGYAGPLSVEWEDCGMNRIQGATEACDFVKAIDFTSSKSSARKIPDCLNAASTIRSLSANAAVCENATF